MDEAKLNAKKRKSLPGKSFCGPDRSFPANDCNHVKAGLSLLGRYKGPGNKANIKACLYRKAKAKGCFKSSKEAADESLFRFEPVIKEYWAMYEAKMLTLDDLTAELIRFAQMGSIPNTDMFEMLNLLSIDAELAVEFLIGSLASGKPVA